MESLREHSIQLCDQLGVLYWEFALMGPKMRGSKVRVRPHKDMIRLDGYLKQVVVMGVVETVLFDSLYLDHYKEVTGVDYRLQWDHSGASKEQKTNKGEPSSIALETLAEFLKSGNISLTGSNPRHSLLIKFKTYLESQQNDRS